MGKKKGPCNKCHHAIREHHQEFRDYSTPQLSLAEDVMICDKCDCQNFDTSYLGYDDREPDESTNEPTKGDE